jgi:ATP-dependent DNA helicase RecG
MPPGRQPVSTYLVEPDKQAKWWHFVREKLAAGRQAFVVVPLVEESETAAVASVAAAYEQLTNGELADFRVGMVHGRMTPQEKTAAMADFRAGRIQALVSTSVIEVGIDVPNASIMIVDSPQRFGLAQLHQLRGRIGRGAHPGYCGLLVDDQMTEPARARLAAFAATVDGFALAELDFAERGPGDLFGTEQHGMAPLRIADLQRDAAVVAEARQAAERLFSADAGLAYPEHQRLRRQMLTRYGKALELGDVG